MRPVCQHGPVQRPVGGQEGLRLHHANAEAPADIPQPAATGQSSGEQEEPEWDGETILFKGLDIFAPDLPGSDYF